MMKKLFMFLVLGIGMLKSYGQTTVIGPGEYKSMYIPIQYNYGDYTRYLVLLHEAYDATLLAPNYAIGTITALRGNAGAYTRFNVAQINSTASYNYTSASVFSIDGTQGGGSSESWKLKTCIYNGKKYLALAVPYAPAHHDQGYKFTGWSISSAEGPLVIAYTVNGQPVNQNVLSNIQDFNADQTVTNTAQAFNFLGNVGIGTVVSPADKLAVKGRIHAQEIKVDIDAQNWPDYVFEEKYPIRSLAEVGAFIKANKHLPEIPSVAEVRKNGVQLGELNTLLLKKIEEQTLYIIEQEKKNIEQDKKMKAMMERLEALETKKK